MPLPKTAWVAWLSAMSPPSVAVPWPLTKPIAAGRQAGILQRQAQGAPPWSTPAAGDVVAVAIAWRSRRSRRGSWRRAPGRARAPPGSGWRRPSPITSPSRSPVVGARRRSRGSRCWSRSRTACRRRRPSVTSSSSAPPAIMTSALPACDRLIGIADRPGCPRCRRSRSG